MLDQIDLDRRIDKDEARTRLAELQSRLSALQQRLFATRTPALVVVEGWAGTGKARVLSTLVQRLDPRGLVVHPIAPPRTAEQQYHWLHRFWLRIPAYGQLALFDRSWYRQLLAERVEHQGCTSTMATACNEVLEFERLLADDGMIILKLWLHISKREQRRRFRKLRANPVTAYQVTDEDRRQNRHYGRYLRAVEDLVAHTHTAHAPWIVLPATDEALLRVLACEALVAHLEARLGFVPVSSLDVPDLADRASRTVRAEILAREAPRVAARAPIHVQNGGQQAPSLSEPGPAASILDGIDLARQLDQETYSRRLRKYQAKLHLLAFQAYLQRRPVVFVFEGWDAAGKGGAIKRLTETIDPRGLSVYAIAAPAGEDQSRHYLYRFWRRLPPRGQITVFDRSWYGRVLVERVEGFAREPEWRRAYDEINTFERQLLGHGMLLFKFWLHISKDEQLRRFVERQRTPHKSWKLTDEDWRNRERWDDYLQAADEMLLRTSTPRAPWTIIPAEDKLYARIAVLSTAVRGLEAALGKVTLDA